MFLNLIWLFIVLINSEKKDLKNILKYSILWSIFVILIWLKECFFPTFDYWNLSNRAIWTFGHPNYLALYLLLLVPFLIYWIKNIFYKITLFLLIILLFLTKSVWWIFIFIIYILFIIYNEYNKYVSNKYIYWIWILLLFILIFIVYKFWLITKLNSFISRFYIWETVINIIFSNIKNILLWVWADSLSYTFDIYKSTELYIYENIWYTADRPHNLILNIFYHFWIFWLGLFIFIIYKIFNIYKNNPYYHSLILFIIFTIFNFPSISHYLIIILIWSIIYLKEFEKNKLEQKNILNLIPYIFITLIWIYWSIIYYNEEHKVFIDKWNYSENKYYNLLLLEDPETRAMKERHSVEEACSHLIKAIPSVENYFFCGNLYWNFNKKEAINNYKEWLKLLPDMWDENSKYYEYYFIKKLFVPERFYAEKFSNIKEILRRVWIK